MKEKLWKITGIVIAIMILGLAASCSAPDHSDKSESILDSEEKEISQSGKDEETNIKESENTAETEKDSLEISWEEAKDYDGKTVTVTGPVVDYFYSEGWEFTTLGIGKADEGGVSVVIYDKDAHGFPDDMESYYMGKVVSITGEISYRATSDISQINISNPDQIKVVSEGDDAIAEEEVSKIPGLTFSYTDKYPEYWGNVRIVDPLLVEFGDIEILDEGFVITVSGKIKGSSNLSSCFNPDMGIFTAISGLVIGKDGSIKWEQDGYLRGTGSYIKEGEIKEFMLINNATDTFEPGDRFIIIAYTEGGMIEDSVMDADKGVFGEYQAIYNP